MGLVCGVRADDLPPQAPGIPNFASRSLTSLMAVKYTMVEPVETADA